MNNAIIGLSETPRWSIEKRLDLGCGNNKKEGFTGVDITTEGTQADISCDLMKFPWPFNADSVEEVFCSHYFEHVPARIRPNFMDELWRIMKVGGTVTFITPYCWSAGAVQDYTHEWPPITGESYLYFSRNWRHTNGLEHAAYDLKCNFKIKRAQYFLNDEMMGVNAAEVDRATKRDVNVVNGLLVELEKLEWDSNEENTNK